MQNKIYDSRIKKGICLLVLSLFMAIKGAVRQSDSGKYQLLEDMLVSTTDHYKVEQNKTKFVFIVPSYCNKQWYRRNLGSIFFQQYDNYRVIYIDDCSSDDTGKLVDAYVKKMNQQNRFNLIINTERKKAMANIYHAVHMCDDDEVVVMLDGDDWLAHEHVLELLNTLYADPNVWMTFGSFSVFPEGRGWAADIPQEVIDMNAFRFFQPAPSHLRTFYAGLFKQIKKEDLYQGDHFYEYTYDLAMMFPMIEMAGERFKFISQIVYIYNDANSINDHKVGKINQRQTDLIIRNKKRYKRIKTLFHEELTS